MYFELRDGKPIFALAKTVITEQVETPEGIKEVQRDLYIFTQEELQQYPDAITIDQPTAEILERAKQLEDKTLSKSEFERMLLSPIINDTEQRIADIEAALASLLGGGV